jgi:putative heme transporter
VSFYSGQRLTPSGLRLLAREIVPTADSDAAGGTARLMPVLTLVVAGVLATVVTLHGHEFMTAIERAAQTDWRLAAAGALFEAASVAGYVVLLHRIVSADSRLRLKDSYDITLAGTAATRLLPTAGLGGAAVTVWALRARGLSTKEVTERLLAFLLLLYAVYMAALVLSGGAVALGLVHVSHGSALGFVGAGLGLTIGLLALAPAAAPQVLAGALRRAALGSGRRASFSARALEQLPAFTLAQRRARRELRRPSPALLGALAWWGFYIAVLFTMLHAFGATLPAPALVLAYFLGSMFNVLPLPGSLSGGLVGVLIALGTPVGATIAAVLAYRAIAVWLPAASGLASSARLRTSVARWRAERPVAVAPAECA